MNRKIMILGAGLLQLPAILKAKELGLDVVAVDMNPEAIGFKEKGIIKEVISTIDIPMVIEAAKRHNINGIMTMASDMPMRTVSAVSKELNLKGLDEETALKATNKYYMRVALKNNNVPIPKFMKISGREDYKKALQLFKPPFIVKPVDNSGSRGICRIDENCDIKSIYEAYDYSKSYSRSGYVLVEEYMTGNEVSVETLSVNGECHVIQITDKITTGAPRFVEIGHSQPSQLDSFNIDKIIKITKEANKAVGITDGPSHTEIIVTSEGPKIVELGARLGGDCITSHLVPLSTGVDMVECCIKIALGEKVNIEKKYSKGSAISYFSQHEGIIKEITGLERARKTDGIKQISFVYDIGDYVSEIKDSASRIGFVIAQGKDAFDAKEICKKAMKEIKIKIQ